MVFCFQKISELLWEKKCSSDREKLLKLKDNFQKLWDNYNNLFEQWKVGTIFETDFF